ncbi:AI-2E family transporter [Thermococcus radiotolerans]|uniref:AI-2E family transporter n=1 Tax=Thermococcus radiotolerans TaxID=187880 RepID=A0A2Z2MY18_9EURY|nr:AI-2E family transporter [Thermococcus radiotolerans]ASJ14331.1 AI-2E family transporter [Thermococcus radiotolerans]
MELEAGIWIAVSLIVLYLVWETVSPILSPIILAVTLAYILYPLHERLAKKTGNRVSAFTMTAILTLITFLFIIGFALWINDVKSSLAYYINAFFEWLLTWNLPAAVYELLQKLAEDIPNRFEEYVLGYTYSLPKLSLQAIVMVFAFYGMLINARAIRREVYSLLPPENRELAIKLLEKAGETLHSLLRGWLAISILKGVFTAGGFILFELAKPGGAIAAGIFTVIFELLPVFGGWVVWLAGAVYMLNSGNVAGAIVFALYGIVFISPLPDILLRPRLGTREKGVNALISLVGIFGGYLAFGFVGIIIGPVALSLLATLVEEWKEVKVKSAG